MFETVKVVKGVEIYRYKGTKFPYMINVYEGPNPWDKCFYSFRTCKAAVEFLNNTAK